MKKQTSIEWYAQKDTEITIQFLQGEINQFQLAIEKTKCLNEAKEMHKQEIIDAYANEVYSEEGNPLSAEEYYKEEFENEN